MKSNGTAAARKLVKSKAGIFLDVSYGGEPQAQSVVLSKDLAHDPIVLPLPLPDASVHTCVVQHVLEFLPAERWFDWWNELHRVMRPGGIVYVSGPYGGDESRGWLSDPTHRTRVVEETFVWLDPRTPFYVKHKDLGRPEPQPWQIAATARVPAGHGTYSYNVTLRKPEATA